MQGIRVGAKDLGFTTVHGLEVRVNSLGFRF